MPKTARGLKPPKGTSIFAFWRDRFRASRAAAKAAADAPPAPPTLRPPAKAEAKPVPAPRAASVFARKG